VCICAEPLSQFRTSTSCCVDCGPDSYVLGDFDTLRSGCNSQQRLGSYTRELCDSVCRANLADRCSLYADSLCYMYNETSPGSCDNLVETVSDYQRWTVCNGSSALLRHVSCVLPHHARDLLFDHRMISCIFMCTSCMTCMTCKPNCSMRTCLHLF
jgi:hypothetical protein